MRILLAVDGSPYSEMVANALKALQLPSQNEVVVMTVVPEYTFLGGITLHKLRGNSANRKQAREAQEQKATELLKGLEDALRASGLKVTSQVCWGSPAEVIIKRSREIGAHLLAIGVKGAGEPQQFLLGSVAQKVMKYAEASVLLVKKEATTIRRVLFATDGSKYSDGVTRFLLDLPLPKQSEVILLTALQSHIAALLKMPTLNLKTNRQILEELQAAEEKAARSLLTKTRKQFQKNGYQTSSMVLKGEPAQEILLAAESLNPELIVLGAKGLTGIESFLLGSVAQRVARYARCSVLIVRLTKV